MVLLVDPLDQPSGIPGGRVFFVGSVRELPAGEAAAADLASPELRDRAGQHDVAASVRLIRQLGSVPVVEPAGWLAVSAGEAEPCAVVQLEDVAIHLAGDRGMNPSPRRAA